MVKGVIKMSRMQLSSARIKKAVRQLQADGHVVVDENQCVRLTVTGEQYATNLLKMHDDSEKVLLQEFFLGEEGPLDLKELGDS